MEIQCKILQPHHCKQLAALINLYADVFEAENFKLPSNEWLVKLLKDNKIIFMTAFAAEELVGGLTAYLLPSVYQEGMDVYLYDLAVQPALQRIGIGTKLIQELTSHSSKMGYREIFVQADAEDLHAIEFYRATGGNGMHALQFSYSLHNQNTYIKSA